MKKSFVLSPLFFSLCIALSLSGCDKRTAEEKGRDKAAEKAGYVKGVGEALKKEGEEAAQSLGEGMGKVMKGTTSGLAGGLASYAIEVAPEATALGLSMTRAELRSLDAKKAEGAAKDAKEESKTYPISAYVIAAKSYTGKLRLIALDSKKNEVGRAVVEVKMADQDAKYIDFAFDERTPVVQVKAVRLQAF